MNFKAKIDADDIFKFSLYIYFFSIRGILLLVGIVVCAAMGVFYREQTDWRVPVAMSLVLVVICLIQFNSIYRKSGKQALAMSEVGMRFSDTGIDLKIGNKKEHANWNQIGGFKKIGDCYVLFTGSEAGFLVPARQLSADQKERFFELLRRNLDDRLKKAVK